MNALERIKEIEHTSYDCEVHDIEFLLRAVRVWRELALVSADRKRPTAEPSEATIDEIAEYLDECFEERMKDNQGKDK